ncbi:DNA integrity scanning diadenylate cyclase DisA [Peptococcaceae bacterium]|nr:DNA integrity scanning diadenylate cyclase DisA [Peptococcaceae bacterium]MCL0052106.1 DNA integrity scanning diadenylate cyclase DisA [Peptococcaceae bacterium]
MGKENREQLLKLLRKVAPGTPLREGLENILKAKTGALIVLSDKPEVMKIVEGGFKINASFMPATLYELAKMDGAIILTEDAKKIIAANVQLTPDSTIPSSETGIRHRTAERVSKQTGAIVISISQRREIITLYTGTFKTGKYVLKDVEMILTKANQAIQTLEKYRFALDEVMQELSMLEFENAVTLYDVVKAVQRVEKVLRVEKDIEYYISELGTDGRMIAMQLEELLAGVKKEGPLVIQDYSIDEEKTPEEILNIISEWPSEDLLEQPLLISRALGYSGNQNILDQNITPRGYRMLRKIPKLPIPVIENLVSKFGILPNILNADIEDLDEVEGIGEVRARSIKHGLRSIKHGLSRYRDKLIRTDINKVETV